VAGGVGAGVGIAMSGVNLPININGTDINSPVLSSFITGSVASGAGHIAGGTTAGLLWGNSFKESFHNSLNGLGRSMLVGGSFASATTSAFDIANGINPINGKKLLESRLSNHAQVRQQQRGLSVDSIQDALDNPLDISKIRYDNKGRPSVQYIGRRATVVVNPTTGKIITVFPTHSKILTRFISHK
ncbi:MAG: DUF4258 domain-containing protein, partial [Bacteroidales bacterium]|nr:DUF4258 domain-containing protein [Bacteroidales bacterium]